MCLFRIVSSQIGSFTNCVMSETFQNATRKARQSFFVGYRLKTTRNMSNGKLTKKLINDPERAVDDCLLGFVSANPHVRQLKDYRVVVRSDVRDFAASRKVALVCGGGSGHEPVFAGFVGRGMLTAAIAGSVFTSPPPSHIFAALEAVQNPTGTLVFVINYTGDRLNFGLAVERANQELAYKQNGPIRVVIIGEDTALTSADKSAGRRGLAGNLLVLKIAGALSEEGLSLEEIANVAEDIAENMGTIGLSLSSCSLPGGGHIFQLGEDEMELGLGVHGEPGVQRLKLRSAKDTVDLMLSHMTREDSVTKLELAEGEETVLLINNLGGLTQMEIGILCGEILTWLGNRGVLVRRIFSGSLMTSLEMQGVGITLLRLSKLNVLNSRLILDALDASTDASGWPTSSLLPESGYYTILPPLELPNVTAPDSGAENRRAHFEYSFRLNPNDAVKFQACLLAACDAILNSEHELNQLDGAAGDGDCGSTLKRGAQAVKEALSNGDLAIDHPGYLFHEISKLWERDTGGTSIIYAIAFTAAAQVLKNQASSCSDWTKALSHGIDAIMKYGRASPGDRTMLDALDPALKEAWKVANSNGSGREVFGAAVQAAEIGAEATTKMKAKAGRASYVSEANLVYSDPGAKAVAIWMRAAFQQFAS